MFDHINDLSYEGFALLKSFETVWYHPIGGFHTYNKIKTLLRDLQRPVKRFTLTQSVKTNSLPSP